MYKSGPSGWEGSDGELDKDQNTGAPWKVQVEAYDTLMLRS